jgi:hypothetical protein
MSTIHHRARPVVWLLAACLALLVVVAPASAAGAQQVTIVSHVTFNPDGPNYGDFVASGPAVDSGVICPTGTFVDTFVKFAGFQSDRGVVQLKVGKWFTCGDGSGSFGVKMQIQANFDTGLESFSWVVMGGDGRYGSLNGAGPGSTVPNAPIGNINTFTGILVR